jgi:hypothetical protein
LFRFVSSSKTIGKSEGACEDACLTTKRGLGVIDGVGDWVNYGFSSDKFANQLMRNCKRTILDLQNQDDYTEIKSIDVFKKGKINSSKKRTYFFLCFYLFT